MNITSASLTPSLTADPYLKAVVRALQAGQLVTLTRQPWNSHDPLAVSVSTLFGAQIGYIPKTSNQRFQVSMRQLPACLKSDGK